MTSLYVHIPYCASKCKYCDFYTKANSSQVPLEYVNAVLYKIKQHNATNVSTLYFGGGTPSLLSAQQVRQIINTAQPLANAEITLEVNPESVTKQKMQDYFSAGVNRISIGVQTANDESLGRIGRKHSAAQAKMALEAITNAGFNNISGDIMIGLPFYSNNEFDETLQLLQSGGATHISSYILKLEEKTVFGKNPPQGLPTDDEISDFYLYSVKRMEELGFAQYEISNFAKKGFESRHNLTYWNCEDYIGIGASAHGCVNNKRFFYEANTVKFVNDGEPMPDGECTSSDYIMLMLRLNSGLSLNTLKQKWGAELSDKALTFLKKCEKENMCVFNNDTIALTPKGMLLQNSILCNII